MFVLEGELKSYAHACDFVCVKSELDDSFTMSDSCNMVVYHECLYTYTHSEGKKILLASFSVLYKVCFQD